MPGSRRVLAGILASLLAVAACGPNPSPSPSPPVTSAPGTGSPAWHVRVTLGIYSGRMDPSWILADAEATAVEAALAALPPSVCLPPVGGLGYRGFTIDREAGIVVAYRGVVAPRGEGPRPCRTDPRRTIERLLLEMARPHLAANEQAEVTRDLSLP